jgi:hypothetical protein
MREADGKLGLEVFHAVWAATGPTEIARRHWIDLMQEHPFDTVSVETQRLIPSIFFNLREERDLTERDRLRGAFKYTWSKTTRMLRDTHLVLAELNARTINYRVIKGAAIQAVVGQVGTRVMGDVDLVVHASDSQKVEAAFYAAGFRKSYHSQCSRHGDKGHVLALTFNRGETHVDVHLAEVKEPSTLLMEMLRVPPAWLRTAGGEIPVPPTELLFLHAAHHGQLAAGPSDQIQSILDVCLLRTRIDHTALLEAARRTHTSAALLAIDVDQRHLRLPSLHVRPQFTFLARVLIESLLNAGLSAARSSNQALRLIDERRRDKPALSQVKDSFIGRRRAYALWLRLGQFSALERHAIRRWGGFLKAPRGVLELPAMFNPFQSTSEAITASNVAPSNSQNLDDLDAAVYCNGLPVTRFAKDDPSSRSFELRDLGKSIEISIRPAWPVCSFCYTGFDDMHVTVESVAA